MDYKNECTKLGDDLVCERFQLLQNNCYWNGIGGVQALSLNNSLTGEPVVECGPDNIEVGGRTLNPFDGVIYVKNWRRNPSCFQDYEAAVSNPKYAISLSDLSQCGLEIRRNTDTRELEIFGVFVFSFHPNFVTFGDRAFAVHCVFKQKDVDVNGGFNLKPLSTIEIGATAPLPSVELKIVYGTKPETTTEPAKTLRVGDPITFIWRLSIPSEIYGIRVGDCAAETLRGRRAKVIEDGCSLDSIAISHIKYAKDENMGSATAMAFKFADDEDIWFKCDVRICIKAGPGSPTGDSEDYCPPIKECKRRSKRHIEEEMMKPIKKSYDGTVLEQQLLILDSYNQQTHTPHTYKGSVEVVKNTNAGKMNRSKTHPPSTTMNGRRRADGWKLCLRRPIFALLSSVLLFMYAITFFLAAFASFLYCHSHRSHSRSELSASDCSAIWTENPHSTMGGSPQHINGPNI